MTKPNKFIYELKILKYFFYKNKYLALTTLIVLFLTTIISNLYPESKKLISIIMSLCTSLIFLCINVILGNFFNKKGKIPKYKDSLYEIDSCISSYFSKYFGIDNEVLRNTLFELEEEHFIVHCKIPKSENLNIPFEYIYTKDHLIKTGFIVSFDKNSNSVDPIKNEYTWIGRLKKDLMTMLENVENMIILTSDEKIKEESLYIKNLLKISVESFLIDDGKTFTYDPNKFMISLDKNSYYIKSFHFPSYELYLYFNLLKTEYFSLPVPWNKKMEKANLPHLGNHRCTESIMRKYKKLFK